jgi:hypothetical protein
MFLVHRGKQRVRRLPVDHQIDRAGAIVDVEHFLPGLPAVARAEDAALLVAREQMPHCGDINGLRVGGMNDDARDVMGVWETHQLPGLTGVRGLEDAFA